MKTDRIEIQHFDVFYMTNGISHRDMKEVLMSEYRNIPVLIMFPVDDLELVETHEIMQMPVIKLEDMNIPVKRPLMLLKILCMSYSNGCLYMNYFSGFDWQINIIIR